MTPSTRRTKHLLVLAAFALLDCNSAEAPAAHSPEPPSAAPGPSGKRAPCSFGADQTCNDDPKVSALWGHCTELGVCECQSGFELSPISKRCTPAR
ncbi:MAG TPA: hypothetical protein VK524_02000 [Polyangiaceae bacterium]|nr:hypothetical protein [Polyangiaceae bacterium]